MNRATRHLFLPRRLLPMLLAGIGVWGLVGCVYLPLPEHAAKGEKDLRSLFGQLGSPRPLTVGRATRKSVVDLVGVPPYLADDGRSVAYVFKTEGSLWIWPLCFQAEPATEGYFAVRVTFDERDVLVGWKFSHHADSYSFYPVHASVTPKESIDQLNSEGSTLRPNPAGKQFSD